MSGIEFNRWVEYYNQHPFGTEWEDVRMAVLSANICNALTGKPQTIGSHLATYGKEQKPTQTVEQQYNLVAGFVAMSKMAAKVKSNG